MFRRHSNIHLHNPLILVVSERPLVLVHLRMLSMVMNWSLIWIHLQHPLIIALGYWSLTVQVHSSWTPMSYLMRRTPIHQRWKWASRTAITGSRPTSARFQVSLFDMQCPWTGWLGRGLRTSGRYLQRLTITWCIHLALTQDFGNCRHFFGTSPFDQAVSPFGRRPVDVMSLWFWLELYSIFGVSSCSLWDWTIKTIKTIKINFVSHMITEWIDSNGLIQPQEITNLIWYANMFGHRNVL